MNGSQEGDNYVLFNSDIPNTTIYEQNTGELEYNVPPTLSTRCQPVLMTRDNFSQFNHFNYDLESMFGEPTYNSIELSRFNKWVIYYYYYTIHSLENKDITKLPINLTLIYLTTFRCKSFSVWIVRIVSTHFDMVHMGSAQSIEYVYMTRFKTRYQRRNLLWTVVFVWRKCGRNLKVCEY